MIGITDRFLVAIGMSLLVYELVVWGMAYFINEKYKKALISPRVREVSMKYPIVPFLAGVLCGHWWQL